jgi:hypothetical protein
MPVLDVDVETALSQLARQINAEHQAGQQARRKGLDHYRQAGQRLIAAREECQRQGLGFTTWLKDNKDALGFGTARAYHYVNLAEFLVTRNPSPEELEAEWRRISSNAAADDRDDGATAEDGEPGTKTLSPARRLRQSRIDLGKAVKRQCDAVAGRLMKGLRSKDEGVRYEEITEAADELIEIAKGLLDFAKTDRDGHDEPQEDRHEPACVSPAC